MRVLVVYAHPIPWSFNHAILEAFTKGLEDGGHTPDVVDLYAIGFNPVATIEDLQSCISADLPEWVMKALRIRESILLGAKGPIQRFMAKRWLRNATLKDIAHYLSQRKKPQDLLEQQVKQVQLVNKVLRVILVHKVLQVQMD